MRYAIQRRAQRAGYYINYKYTKFVGISVILSNYYSIGQAFDRNRILLICKVTNLIQTSIAFFDILTENETLKQHFKAYIRNFRNINCFLSDALHIFINK